MRKQQTRAERFTTGLRVQYPKTPKKLTTLAREYRATTYEEDMDAVCRAIERSGRSLTAVANLSGVSRSCLVSWQKRKTRRPNHTTLKFALRGIGGHFEIVVPKKIR